MGGCESVVCERALPFERARGCAGLSLSSPLLRVVFCGPDLMCSKVHDSAWVCVILVL